METYTIFLLKDSIGAIAEALDPEEQTRSHALSEESPVSGNLYVGAQNRAIPPWVQMMNPYLEEPVENAHSASISAVLIISHRERFFAVTFGHGKSLLRPTSWVRDFGLRVTLNRVNPAGLRSMDSKIYDDLVVTTRKQTSRSSNVDSFELDVGRALLRGVTGNAEEGSPFRRLTGSDCLRLTTELSFAHLDQLLEEVMLAYEDDAYQTHFPWFDNIQEVDPALNTPLNDLLIASLGNMDTTDAYLAPGEVVDWEEINAFNYTGGRATVAHLELNLRDYLQIVHSRIPVLTVDFLQRHRIRVRYEGHADWRNEWSVYDCLVWETTFQGRRCVLFDGRWFAIEADFANQVEAFIAGLHSTSIAFIDAEDGQRESVYNAAMVDTAPDVYALLDLETFLPTGGATRIEFCDILSVEGKIVHIKKRSSSATLSHLFSQGAVSADLFLQDQGLRALVRANLGDAQQKPALAQLITVDRPIPAQFEVVYGIIAREGQHGWPPPLPFFSAVNLTHHARRVQNLGFQVSLQYIRQG